MYEYGDMPVISYVRVEMCELSGHNVRVIGYVRVEMCEWSGRNVRVNMKCTSASAVMCE